MLNNTNAQKLWLFCIKKLNQHKSPTIVDSYKHCLLLVKDLAYHYAYRQKPFREEKESNQNFLTLDFCNKLIEEVNLHLLFNDKAIIERFPFDLLDGSKIVNWDKICKPAISYRYSDKIRGKLLNYNQVLSSDETAENLTCDCHNSHYVNSHHKHIVTGDMNFVKDTNLRKLLNEGLSFRLPQPRNIDKALKSFRMGLDEYVESLSKKFKLPEVVFDNWKIQILQCIKLKLNTISTKTEKFLDTESAFIELKKLQDKFVLVPTDKSANNISIVCKKFYLSCIQNELEDSFTLVNKSPEQIIESQKDSLKKFNILRDEGCNDLSSFNTSCKQHKLPVKSRYTTSTTRAASKPLARLMTVSFITLQAEIIKSCNSKDYIRKNNNKKIGL